MGHWPLNRDLSEARQGFHGAGSKASLWHRPTATLISEEVYLITRLGTLDARPRYSLLKLSMDFKKFFYSFNFLFPIVGSAGFLLPVGFL